MARAPRSSTRSSSSVAAHRVEDGDRRRRVQALLVHEAPVVVEPLVERAEDLVGDRHLGRVEALDAHREGREQERPLQALLVHHPEPRVALLVVVGQRLQLAVPGRVHRAAAGALVVLRQLLEPLVERAGLGDRVERGVRHHRLHDVAEEEVAPLALRHPAHEALDLVVAVPGERVLRLVVVVVGVDQVGVHGRLLVAVMVPPNRQRGNPDGQASGSTRSRSRRVRRSATRRPPARTPRDSGRSPGGRRASPFCSGHST